MTKRGHRLVYSNGIIVLAGRRHACWWSSPAAEVTRLIPLYAIGVFTGFTLSQAGMTKHHLAPPRARLAAGPGRSTASARVLSAVVAVVIAVTKFADGAWVILIVLPGAGRGCSCA